jgi:hypothetical protein
LRTLLLATGLAASALGGGLAACGASTSSTTPAPSRTATAAGQPTTPPASVAPAGPGLSRVALVAKAAAICTAATAEGRKLAAPADLTSNPRAAAAYFNKAVPPLDAETKALQALVAAPAVSDEWEAVLGAQTALDGLADGYRQKADAGHPTTLADIAQLGSVGQTIASAAIRLGLRCD